MDGRLSTSIGEVQAKTVSPRNLNLDPQMDFFDPKNLKFDLETATLVQSKQIISIEQVITLIALIVSSR